MGEHLRDIPVVPFTEMTAPVPFPFRPDTDILYVEYGNSPSKVAWKPAPEVEYDVQS